MGIVLTSAGGYAVARPGKGSHVYSATGVDRQFTRFSAEDGRDLQKYDVRVYSTHHEDREYILSQTTQPPSDGPIIAVHVTYLDAAAAAITAPRARTGHTPPAWWAAQNDNARDRSFGAPTPSRWPTTDRGAVLCTS